ncbi:unnamed protein product [Rotaria magnacalcarata]
MTRSLNENETIESVLCGHSELLVIALNLIQEPAPKFIQVVKNLRVCGHCHEFTKVIAKIEQCDIVVRDANRIHHFYPNGQSKTLDYGTAQQLSLSKIEKLDRSREQKSFEPLLETINNFCWLNSIIINDKPKQHRNRTISVTFKDSIVNSIIGQRDDNQNEEFYRTTIYYQLIDNILIELKDRFSLKKLQFLCGISTLSPDSDSFLHFESIKTFASHLNLNLDFLFNKLTVAKPMLKYKSLGNTIDLYRSRIASIPRSFSSSCCINTKYHNDPSVFDNSRKNFSKMKMIKTKVRNTMTDERLNDLCVLVAKHDIDVNFEEIIDDFANAHKNSRIMPK